MKATEFRIGNLAMFAAGIGGRAKIGLVNSDNIHNVKDRIPLTIEWLDRFGLHIVDTESSRYKYLNGYVPLSTVYLHFESKRVFAINYSLEVEEDVTHPDIKIEYVHQLQNLFYALTGEELTIKES